MNLRDYLNSLKSSARIITEIILLLFLFAAVPVSAQMDPVLKDSNRTQIDTSKFVMKKSPWGAVIRSAILPGFGQFYNESYWKIPVVWGGFVYLGYQWDKGNSLYKKYKDLYTASVNANNIGDETLRQSRDFYRDQRDLIAVFIGLAYFLNLVDAYVDAHLFDFEVPKDSRVAQYQLSMKIKF